MELKISQDDSSVGYLYLNEQLGDESQVVSKSINVNDFIDSYDGPDIILDFTSEMKLVGIEIIG